MATLYEKYITDDDSQTEMYGTAWRAQTFTPSTAHTITSVKLKLWRFGSPGTITVGIRATSAAKPTGADLCSGTTNGNTLTTDTAGEWREITLGAGTMLSASTMYAIVVRATAGDALNFVRWRTDLTSPAYTGGGSVYSSNSGSSWTVAASDNMFEEWGNPITNFTRSLTTAIGLSASITNSGGAFTRELTTAIGLQASLDVSSKNRGSWLCVASRDSGSTKTREGTSWSSCAKDANGDLQGSNFAQYLNRLCVLNYENLGFSYSDINDIVANWTNKPDFPNLPQSFTELFVGRDAGDDPVLNFLTPIGMYYLDVFANFVFGPTECTWEEDEDSGKKGLYWKGDHYVAVGKGIYRISKGVVDLVGPDMDDGLPENLQGVITDMIGVGFWLVIALDGGASKKSCILKRYISGKHWHPVYVGSLDTPIRALCWDSGTLYFGEGSDVKSLPLPNTTDNPKQLSDHDYCATGEFFYPYFHSIFEAMTKVAHNVWATTQDCDSDEKITVSYRKDEDTAWTELGSFTSSPSPTALPFPASGDSIGVEFERIQFKAAFARGSTTTNSPKMESLILEFRVTPPVLWGWDVQVLATTSGDRRGQDIIDALITAIETKTLLGFYPSGDKSKTEYFVSIEGMPSAQKGTAFGEEGVYEVSLQQVVD